MKSFRHFFTLALFPLGFFAILAALQLLIFWQAYQQKADRQIRPYAYGYPVPTIEKKIDRRPQSINIPSLEINKPAGADDTMN